MELSKELIINLVQDNAMILFLIALYGTILLIICAFIISDWKKYINNIEHKEEKNEFEKESEESLKAIKAQSYRIGQLEGMLFDNLTLLNSKKGESNSDTAILRDQIEILVKSINAIKGIK